MNQKTTRDPAYPDSKDKEDLKICCTPLSIATDLYRRTPKDLSGKGYHNSGKIRFRS